MLTATIPSTVMHTPSTTRVFRRSMPRKNNAERHIGENRRAAQDGNRQREFSLQCEVDEDLHQPVYDRSKNQQRNIAFRPPFEITLGEKMAQALRGRDGDQGRPRGKQGGRSHVRHPLLTHERAGHEHEHTHKRPTYPYAEPSSTRRFVTHGGYAHNNEKRSEQNPPAGFFPQKNDRQNEAGKRHHARDSDMARWADDIHAGIEYPAINTVVHHAQNAEPGERLPAKTPRLVQPESDCPQHHGIAQVVELRQGERTHLPQSGREGDVCRRADESRRNSE